MQSNAITTLEMAVIDRNCEYLGIPRRILMENAGREVARYILNSYKNIKKITVVSGLGDNGGDGAVAARYLYENGIDTKLIILGRICDSRSDIARQNFEICKLVGIEVLEIQSPLELYSNMDLIVTWPDATVDAILGTGIRGTLREPQYSAIKLINMSRSLKISVDVPSGLDPDTGDVRDIAVKADVTITMHKPKVGLLTERASKYVGKLVVVDIGIPREAEHVAGPGDLLYLKWRRRRESRKGEHGRIIIVGGSDEFAGAPALAALAAFRVGVDIVTVIAPRTAAHDIRSQSPNLIVLPIEGKYFIPEHVDTVYKYCTRADVILIGPGISTRDEALDFAAELYKKLVDSEKKVIVDADGIKALAKHELSKYIKKNVVVTSHQREYEMLIGKSTSQISNPWKKAEEISKQVKEKCDGGIIVLKGNIDIITNGDRWKINMTGNPAMTVGGTGDVLSGTLAAILTKCEDVLEAACIATFIVGIAGDLATQELGYHILPTDVIEKIPIVMKGLLNEEKEINNILHETSRLLLSSFKSM